MEYVALHLAYFVYNGRRCWYTTDRDDFEDGSLCIFEQGYAPQKYLGYARDLDLSHLGAGRPLAVFQIYGAVFYKDPHDRFDKEGITCCLFHNSPAELFRDCIDTEHGFEYQICLFFIKGGRELMLPVLLSL
ncbi:hypothetical protein ES703_113209 [subsurface metagenome]